MWIFLIMHKFIAMAAIDQWLYFHAGRESLLFKIIFSTL